MRSVLITVYLVLNSAVFAGDQKPGRFYIDQPDVNDDFQIHLIYLLAKDSDDREWDFLVLMALNTDT